MENSFKEKDFHLQAIQKLEETLDTSDLLLQTIETEIKNISVEPQQGREIQVLNVVATPVESVSLEQREKMVGLQRRNLSFLQQKIQKDINLHQPITCKSDQTLVVCDPKLSIMKNAKQVSSTANHNFNIAAAHVLSLKEDTKSIAVPKTTFFIGTTDSDSYYTSESDGDFDSDSEISDNLSDSDISDSEDFVPYKEPKLFAKSNLNLTNKRPSLLSMQLQRNQFRKIQSEIHMPTKSDFCLQEDLPVQHVDLSKIDMSASLLQNLHLDHFKGFNTTRNERGKDQAQVTYSLDYW
jgi:hypothetical protein